MVWSKANVPLLPLAFSLLFLCSCSSKLRLTKKKDPRGSKTSKAAMVVEETAAFASDGSIEYSFTEPAFKGVEIAAAPGACLDCEISIQLNSASANLVDPEWIERYGFKIEIKNSKGPVLIDFTIPSKLLGEADLVDAATWKLVIDDLKSEFGFRGKGFHFGSRFLKNMVSIRKFNPKEVAKEEVSEEEVVEAEKEYISRGLIDLDYKGFLIGDSSGSFSFSKDTAQAVTHCQSSPELPQGLSLTVVDKTCHVSGTPTSLLRRKSFSVTASFTDGSERTASAKFGVVNSAPVSSNFAVSFVDFDYTVGEVQGEILISPVETDHAIKDFKIYWGTNHFTKLSDTPIATVSNTLSKLSHTFAANTVIPSGATHLLVYPSNHLGNAPQPSSVLLADISGQLRMRLTISTNAKTADSSPEFSVFGGEVGDSIGLYYGTNCDTLIESKQKEGAVVDFEVNLASGGDYLFSVKNLTSNQCSTNTSAHSYFGEFSDFVIAVGNYNGNIAVNSDGKVLAWGNDQFDTDYAAVKSQLEGGAAIADIITTNRVFTALKSDGSVLSWGTSQWGSTRTDFGTSLDGTIPATKIYAFADAMAAIRSDGSLVVWGLDAKGGNASSVSTQLNGDDDVTDVFGTISSLAALRASGSVVTWGNASLGGNSTAVATDINGDTDVTQITASN